MSEYPINTMVIALDHLEAFIAGGDEAGDVSKSDAMMALNLMRTRTKEMEKALRLLYGAVINEPFEKDKVKRLKELTIAIFETIRVLHLEAQ